MLWVRRRGLAVACVTGLAFGASVTTGALERAPRVGGVAVAASPPAAPVPATATTTTSLPPTTPNTVTSPPTGAPAPNLSAPMPLSPNDPYLATQWALQKIGAPAAWGRSTGAGVKIGIVDTGVDLTHEDLAGKIIASTNCIGSDGNPAACRGSAQDDQGHGTHVAGIASAITNNGKGIAGVAPGSELVVAKALQSTGTGTLPDVNAGIKWVVDHGAQIVNLSVEADATQLSPQPGQSLTEGVEYAWLHGAIVVIAAGNATPSLFGGGDAFAKLDAVMVGATGINDEVAFYSSSLAGAKWGLVAPGGDSRGGDGKPSCAGALGSGCIVSTGWFADGAAKYADNEGTSMAAPQVSGVLALLLALALKPEAAIARLLASTAKVACGPGCRGRLDAAMAVGAAPVTQSQIAPTTTRPPAPSTPPSLATPAAVVTPPTVAPAPPPAVGAPPTTAGPSSPSGAAVPSLSSSSSTPTGSAVALAPSHGRRGGWWAPLWWSVLAMGLAASAASARAWAIARRRNRGSASPPANRLGPPAGTGATDAVTSRPRV